MSIDKDFFDNLEGAYEQATKETESSGNAWKPENEGDQLKGIFLKVDFWRSDYGNKDFQPVGVIRDIKTEESVTVRFSTNILNERIMALQPAPGTPIAIRFDGETRSESGYMYKRHTIAMPDREEGDVILGKEYWIEQRATAVAKDAAKQEERVAVQADRPDEAPF
jgi:hypothetical protein